MYLESDSEPCAYLPGRTASLLFRFDPFVSHDEYTSLLQRGWRRQGFAFFRPTCASCSECRSLRIPLATFRPRRSQRRALQRNAHIRLEVGQPTVTQAHIDLFDVYHQDMHRRRDWPLRHVSAEEYASAFLAPGYYDEDFAREFRYYDGDRLVGVGLVDILPTCASSIYFYHAPDWRPRAPGTYSLMKEIQYCQTRQIEHHYLGYWVPGCPSMDYKARYGPHQILLGRPEADQGAHWIGVADP